MSYIVDPDVVKYACTCGLLKPISKLYFCRHCLELRCGFCVCHEVESYFCGKCAENLASSEAKLKKNRCGNCYDCPSCHQQLSTRAATVGTKNAEDPKSTPKKVFYLLCLNCRWSSRDVGIPDQESVTGGWPERENVFTSRLQEIQDMYKILVLTDKQQKLDKEKKKQKRYMTFTDRTGITASMLRKRVGLPDIKHPLLETKEKQNIEAEAREEVDELPADIFTKPVNLREVTTMEQRLSLPDSQPLTVDKLFPVHKQLSVKRSQRCRSCEHNVSKPEYNPNSIKFKIQLFAYYHIPEVRIVTVEPLRAGQPSELLLKFSNPTQHQTTISFVSLEEVIQKEETDKESSTPEPLSLEDNKSLGSQPSSLLRTSLSRQPSITVKPRAISHNANASITLPSVSFILPQRDDAAEFDEASDANTIQNDPKIVVWRKSNKAVVKLVVTPNEDLQICEEVMAAFAMQHVYVNTITTVESKEPQRCNHHVKVFLTLGPLVGSN